jgi:hypothetical protein
LLCIWQQAALRFVHYWKDKVRIWGIGRAFHKITLSDFEEEDQIALNLGGIQALKDKDKFNRAIMLYNRTRFDLRHRNSQVRKSFAFMSVDFIAIGI